MQIKLDHVSETAVYFTYEYSVSVRIDSLGRIMEFCECGDFLFRHKRCKHIKDVRKSDEFKELMAKQVRK